MSACKEAAKPAEVKVCTCKHEAQDKIYGKQQRLHNPGQKGYKCTVCGHTKSYKS